MKATEGFVLNTGHGVGPQGESHQVLAFSDGRARHRGQRIATEVEVNQICEAPEYQSENNVTLDLFPILNIASSAAYIPGLSIFDCKIKNGRRGKSNILLGYLLPLLFYFIAQHKFLMFSC